MKRKFNIMPNKSVVQELLSYDEVSGTFTWRVCRGGTKKVGDVAGTPHHTGYHHICINGVRVPTHRLVMAMHGVEIEGKVIDHINGDVSDNRFINLRVSTDSENKKNARCNHNSTTKVKNVTLRPNGTYQVRVTVGGVRKSFGLYKTLSEAQDVAVRVMEEHYKEFCPSIDRISM